MADFYPHTLSAGKVLERFNISEKGLSSKEVESQREKYGKNRLPQKGARSLLAVFFHQFLSPFIYILLIAAAISVVFQHFQDALFIAIVLLINAIFGSFQEYYAEKSAEALQKRVTSRVQVIRDSKVQKIDSSELVVGDIVEVESGDKIPADIRLIDQKNCSVDESLLTGESEPVSKDAEVTCEKESGLSDRKNILFAGTHLVRGRAKGVVVFVGLDTEIGAISKTLEKEKKRISVPLVLRMKKFTNKVAIAILFAVFIIFIIELFRGEALQEVFLLSIALAVSAIPEGLPIAITVALSVGMNRMAKRNVIIRKLFAVESLGSCTAITSDKTGTLTMNELTVQRIVFSDAVSWKVTGEGIEPKGEILDENDRSIKTDNVLLKRLLTGACLCNEALLDKVDDRWIPEGDMVDVALLVAGKKAGLDKATLITEHEKKAFLPFESENQFAATVYQDNSKQKIYVKGAPHTICAMCTKELSVEGSTKDIDANKIETLVDQLASEGFRVIALAEKETSDKTNKNFSEDDLKELTFLALFCMIDPLRPEVKDAVKQCHNAGITVSMVTGDHPKTALAIAKELGFATKMDQVITGPVLLEKKKESENAVDAVVDKARVFARVDPTQKVDIVRSLERLGHFIAVTGDGANDAPALSAANVGIAMGKRGTDIARESADLLLTDDNFASIVHGIEEGRVAYSNVRKVIFLLISTAVAEVILFFLSLFFNTALPLLATQLLWLNVITNGIQDIALAMEPAEGNELQKPPRSPNEPIFNQLMLRRVLLSGLYMGISAFVLFYTMLSSGMDIATSRNSTLLLMVLFENVHVFDCRSEYLSVFRHSIFRNKVLLFGTALAQGIHIVAMYTPWLSSVLQVQPVTLQHWVELLFFASTLLVIMEVEKYLRQK